jgi:ABC-2 type transport system ATP-binding protein
MVELFNERRFKMLEIKNISKTYRKSNVKAIDNVSLTIEEGDIFGFIGPNGSGKSTTIKCITGIHSYDEGEIIFDGISIKDKPLLAKQKMAYVPDNPDVYETLTGIDYINFVCDVYGVNEERKELIDKYADMFHIKEQLVNQIKSYSHGMKQKVVLIAALAHKPKLLILDEPFVGLDPKASFVVKKMMKEFCQNGGAIFFSTHILEVAQKLCNKMAIIKQGKLIKEGLMEEITKDTSLEDVFMELTENV